MLAIADGVVGVRLMNVTDPKNFKQLSLVWIGGWVWSVRFSKDEKYVFCMATDGYELTLIDV